MSKDIRIKILGTPIGILSGNTLPRDGDGDGMFTLHDDDNVPLASAASTVRKITKRRSLTFVQADPERKKRIQLMLEKGRDGGFTVDKLERNDIQTGISIGRNRHGIIPKKSEIFDDNGKPEDSAIKLVMAWLDFHGQEVFLNPKNGAREVGIGGWLDGDDFYLDVVDVYDNNKENLAKAVELGLRENQISVANLDQIQVALRTGDWSGTTINSNGDGADTLDISIFKDLIVVYDSVTPPRISTIYEPKRKTLLEMLTSDQNVHIVVSNRKEDTKNG